MSYKQPDKGFYINEDHHCQHLGKEPTIQRFWIDLPKLIEKNYRFWSPDKKGSPPILTPPLEKMANYGLPREEQYWKRREMPMRLQLLIRDISRDRKRGTSKGDEDMVGIIEEIWQMLGSHETDWVNEIQYIKEELYFCYYGYWILIEEKPTWIPPNQYQFLTHWTGSFEVMDRATGIRVTSKYAEYRDVDRRKYGAFLYFFLTTETFENIDPKTWKAIPEADGTYKMKDIGVRTCFGFLRPKGRRAGDTTGFISWQEFMTSCVQHVNSWITTNDPALTEDHWKDKVVPGWQDRPFFMKPTFENSTSPANEISYREPPTRGKKKHSKLKVDNDPLRSKLAAAGKVDRKMFDGPKLSGFQLFDEEGKPSVVDVSNGWDIVKPSMSTGANAFVSKYAFMGKPSTVEEFGGAAAPKYKDQCDQSDPFVRNPLNGQTKSGLVYIFFSGYDGLEGKIGPYGESVIETPTPEQAAYMRSNVGAREYLDTLIDTFKDSKSPIEQNKYWTNNRKYPRCWADMWMLMDGGLGFNIENVSYAKNRLTDIVNEGGDPRVRGDFMWVLETGQAISAEEFIRLRLHYKDIDNYWVKWVPNESGKFLMTQNINPGQDNRRVFNRRMGWWEPLLKKHIAASDPVQYMSARDATKREDKSKSSTAAAAWRLKFDKDIDGNKPRHQWKTGRFVLTYFSKAHNDTITLEEMLMACIYMGCQMFPEVNYPSVVKHFEERGCGGYLFCAYDVTTGEDAKTPGFRTGVGTGTKDAIFSCISAYTDEEILHEDHLEIVEQVAAIQSKEETTKYDGFIAAGGCLLAETLTFRPVEQSIKPQQENQMSEAELIDKWITG